MVLDKKIGDSMNLNDEITKFFTIRRNEGTPFTGKYRFGRDQLVDFMAKQNLKYGAEIGVQQGNFSLQLCQKIKDIHLICIDPWAGGYSKRIPAERNEGFFQETKEKLKDYNVTFMRMRGIEASHKIEDESLDFIYIDAIHDFDNICLDLIHWTPKVKVGGLIAGHDFSYQGGGVVEAVTGYTHSHRINDWYITRQFREMLSFFWIKEKYHINGQSIGWS